MQRCAAAAGRVALRRSLSEGGFLMTGSMTGSILRHEARRCKSSSSSSSSSSSRKQRGSSGSTSSSRSAQRAPSAAAAPKHHQDPSPPKPRRSTQATSTSTTTTTTGPGETYHGPASSSHDHAEGKPRGGLQTWQALFLGSIVTVAIQAAILYSSNSGNGGGAKTPGPGAATRADDRASSPEAEGGRGGQERASQRRRLDLERALRAIEAAKIECTTAEEVLQGYATAPGTSYEPSLPLAAVYPTSTDEVVSIVKACTEAKVRELRECWVSEVGEKGREARPHTPGMC